MTDSSPADAAADGSLPALPTLPGIDLPTLLRPLTDIAGSYGTGDPGVGSSDPTQLLSQVGSALQTATGIGAGALTDLTANWQGQGAQAASDKMRQAQQDNTEIQNQGAQQQSIANQAAQVVAAGRAQINAIMTTLQQQLTQLEPTSSTASGQSAVVSATSNANNQAAQVVSQTQSQLQALTSQMEAAGQPIAVTSAPTGVAANTGARQGQTASGRHGSDHRSAAKQDSAEQARGGKPGTAGGGEFGIAGEMIGDVAMPPLSAWASTRFAGWTPTTTEDSQKNNQKSAPATVDAVNPADDADGTGASPMAPSFMPMGGAGMAGAAMAGGTDYAGTSSGLRANLVSARHSEEVVGDVDSGSYEVVGQTTPPPTNEEWDFSL